MNNAEPGSPQTLTHAPPFARRRDRRILAATLCGVVAIGLLSRAVPLPGLLGKELGDALWTVTVYVALAMVWPRASVARLAMAGLLISYLDEVSQLYHSPGIDRVRATFLGHVLLGTAFGWRDMAAYTVGTALAAAVDLVTARPGRRAVASVR